MGRLAPDQALALDVVERLWAAGVRTFCVCPGGRNAPLVQVLGSLPREAAEVLPFFEERSAAFFALGRARRDQAPVAVVTTSGTAAAELLPAMVEACYSGVRLVAVTADRPRAYRGTGAPQSIQQVGLFGPYAAQPIDIDRPGVPWALGSRVAPAHVNACFDEPLLAGWEERAPRLVGASGSPGPQLSGDGVARSAGSTSAAAALEVEVRNFLGRVRCPLVIVGRLESSADRDGVVAFCRALELPALAEASSGVKGVLGPHLLRSGDAAARLGFERHLFDSVLRVGDIPSFRIWREIELSLHVPVLSISRKPWRGLTFGTHLEVPRDIPLPLAVERPLPAAAEATAVTGATVASAARSGAAGSATVSRTVVLSKGALFDWDRRVTVAAEHLLARFPDGEPALIRRLSEAIPAGAFVYLGNSLPIREWNQFASTDDRGLAVGESRGANGIDGQVSTFLGWASPDRENWAVLGDLTALYDLPALWALRHLENVRVRIVVVNNGGGRIFQRLFRDDRFQNRHAIGFEAWASLWGAEYHAGLPPGAVGPAAIIELRPDDDQTEAFWAQLAAETRG